jgi:hypothetical protein
VTVSDPTVDSTGRDEAGHRVSPALGAFLTVVDALKSLVITVCAAVTGVLLVVAYAAIVLSVNLVLLTWALVNAVFYWLKTRIDGKAIMKRRLEGRIPLLKQKAIELGLDIVELNNGPNEETLSSQAIRKHRRQFGFEEWSKNPWFTPWIPLRPQFRAWLWADEGAERRTGSTDDGDEGEAGSADDSLEEQTTSSQGRPASGLVERARGLARFLSRSSWEAEGTSYVGVIEDVASSRGLLDDFLNPFVVDQDPLPRGTRWVYDTMFLLNTAERSMRRSMGTAYEAYLKAKREIVEGEYHYHKQKEREAGSDGDDEHDGADSDTDHRRFLESEARVVLSGLDECDEQTRRVVTEMLCAPPGGPVGTTRPQPVDGTTLAELVRLATEPSEYDSEGDPQSTEGLTLPQLTQALAVLHANRTTLGESEQSPEPVSAPTPAERTAARLKDDLGITDLKQALKEVHEYRLREYRRFEVLRINILMFVGVPLISLVGFLLVVPSFASSFPSLIGQTLVPLTALLTTETFSLFSVRGQSVFLHSEQVFFGLVLGFGALGAALSGMQKIEHDHGRSESLESILGYWLALVRMAIGAISAFVVLVFLSSGLIDPTILSLPLVLGISAASGVSERLALRAISSFESRAMPEHERPNPRAS